MKQRKLLFGTLFFIASIVVPHSNASATLIFTLGNNPQLDQNVLLNNGDTGATIFGLTNNSGTPVSFSSTTDILTAPASGQARVEAQDGSLNNVTIAVPGGSFTSLILNPFNGSGNAIITAVGTVNTNQFTYGLGNGENFLTVTTLNESLLSLTIDASQGFTDLRQVRLAVTSTSIPESSTLLLLGSGLVILEMVLSRRKRR